MPSSIQNLQAVSVSDNSVIITWREPVTTNGIVNYTIEVRQYTTSTGRDLMLVSLDPEVKRSIPVSMLSPVGEEFTYTIAAQGLSKLADSMVDYTIEVREFTASTGRGLMLVSLDPEVKRSIPISMFTPLGGVFMHIIAEGLGKVLDECRILLSLFGVDK